MVGKFKTVIPFSLSFQFFFFFLQLFIITLTSLPQLIPGIFMTWNSIILVLIK
jgi:hypothetical protein